MKRYGHLWEQICSMDNLQLAHKHARKGKGWYKEVKSVDENPEHYLRLLQDMLVNHTFHTSEYEMFIKREGHKEREIYKLPYFPDRIAQWAILQVIEPILLKNLIANTYSAIPGKGIHAALNDVRNAIQNDVPGTQYCLKFDVRHYYQSIDHEILKAKYRRVFKDPELLMALDEIIDSVDTATFEDLMRLCAAPDEHKGLPIGNYHSQYGGNFYLSSFDHWLKEEKRIKYYYRYMDDIVIFGQSKEELHALKNEITNYLWGNLKLTVKDNWQVFPTFDRGVDFVGYRIFLNYTLLRKTTCEQMKDKMVDLRVKVESGQEMNYSEWCSVNSYNGWLMPCDSFRLHDKYIAPLIPHCEQYYLTHIKRKAA